MLAAAGLALDPAAVLRYEYPPRLLPRTDDLTLADLGVGPTLEVLYRVAGPDAKL